MPNAENSNNGKNRDIFLGTTSISPNLDDFSALSQAWFALQGIDTGEINIQVDYVPFKAVRFLIIVVSNYLRERPLI
jgi:hypothetical protein